ncbi:MAG: hypothetical protein A2075_05270 [Geobacteraceae bacterium GWC2_58_44]|nr:MAG: hypothetical protein A2075_05270 [Geobacteraceae bacterium GWC2_58_44]
MNGTIMQAVTAEGHEQWHHFAGVLLVILLAVLQGRVGRIGTFWQICWALPGTLLHELSHLVVAAVTGGRPVGFSIIPRREASRGSGQRWQLGSVTISRPGPVSALPSALAPLALNVVAYYLYQGWGSWFPRDLAHTLLMYAAVYLFCYSSIPSGQDVRVALSSPFGLLLYAALGAGAWYLWS